jgi:hypothetical protein
VLLAGVMAGCGASYGGTQKPAAASGHKQTHAAKGGERKAATPGPGTAKRHTAATRTPKVSAAPAIAATPQRRSEIPQNNGADGDPDNNGGSDDGDGGI